MVRDKGFSHHDSKEGLQHRAWVECAAGGGVCAVFGANPHAVATVANGSGEGPNPWPSLLRDTYSRKVEEQRAR